MTTASSAPRTWRSTADWGCFFSTLVLLSCYGLWYAGVWPGPMGQDGYSLIANINQGVPRYTGKDPAWLLYALGTYGLSQRIEVMMLPLLLMHVAILSRIIGWIYFQGHRIVAILLLVFIGCAPHILNYATSLYPDGIFSLTLIGVLLEIWITLRRGRLTWWSGIFIFIAFPAAALFKSNGILLILPLAYLAFRLKGIQRWAILLTVIFWMVAVQIGGKVADLGKGHGALQPLVLFETVNFMQSKPMKLWETRHMVTDKTKEIIYRHISQEDLDRLFDRDYWDTLWHQNHDVVKFRSISKQDQRALQREFFTYNLWRNIPAFVSSRVNLFLASAFAQGGLVGPDDAKAGLASVQTLSTYNPFGLEAVPAFIRRAFIASYNWRFILWTPLIGISLIFICVRKAVRQKDRDDLVVVSLLALQLVGIFIFSIAAEYRYLLMFFYAPLLLLPMLFEPAVRNPGRVDSGQA